MKGNPILLILVLWPMIGALIGYLIGRKNKPARDIWADLVTISEFFLLVCSLVSVIRGNDIFLSVPRILDNGLFLKLDGFRALYGTIAGLMWMMTTIFSKEYLQHYRSRNRYYLFTLITFGATVGVFLSADLFTTFIFFEIMSFTSYVMVVHEENPGAMRAGQTYLAVAILGGMVMLMGLFLLRSLVGTLTIDALKEVCSAVPAEERGRLYLSGALILFGFGAKAGMYPLHIWLPKAHPVAPAPASALLSGILTKAGVYGILVLSCQVFLHDAPWGTVILTLGVLTMVTGAVIAVFSINLKRTLACSSVSQIGFILVGIGMQCLLGEHNALAVWGSELHMVNHSLIKLVLFMTAGAIYMKLHKLDLNDIRGYGRGKPVLMLIFLCGYLGIAGIPGFNGYISKTLIHEGIVEYIEFLEETGKSIVIMKCVEWLFLFSGGLTVAYMTKLFAAVFLEKNESAEVQRRFDAMNRNYLNGASTFALGVSALILPVIGLFPSVFMKGIAVLGQGFMNGTSPEHEIAWFSATNLKGAAVSILIGLIVYFGFIRTVLMEKSGVKESPAAAESNSNGSDIRKKRYINRWPEKIDIEDAVYRPLCHFLGMVSVSVSSVFAFFGDKTFPQILREFSVAVSRLFAFFGDKLLPRLCEFFALMISRICASFPDFFIQILKDSVLRKKPIPEDDPAEYQKADLLPEIHLGEETEDVLNSFSFGLLMFGLGLCLMLLILIF